MKQCFLYRFAEHGNAALGVLRHDIYEWFTLEDTWKNNERGVSCIPDGVYSCEMVNSPSQGRTYEVKNVPNRSHILIHAGNTDKDTQGCILLGFATRMGKDETRIENSRDAVEDFERVLAGEAFMLTISTVGR